MEALGQLDLAAARAGHAAWLGAHPARLVVDGGSDGGDGIDSGKASDATSFEAVNLPGMQHPLLLQRYLPPLPRGGKVGADEETEGWGEVAAGGTTKEGTQTDEDGGVRYVQTRGEVTEVVPVDFVVPPGTSLVAITGPNTGGKTASLKALGLALLMVG